ncbi:MAG: sugar phosphate isomerase/epimerase family protein [Balneolaceae bacterium]|nr:sugar phosphate isomerase/epimerase family protein [Balneolaceae bacterium]
MGSSRKEFIIQSLATAAGLSTGVDMSSWSAYDNESTIAAGTENLPPANLKVAVFSKHLQWLDYKPMAETAAKLGFDGVDLTVRPGGHVLPERATEDLPQAVKAVREAGLEVLMMSTAIGGADEEYTEPILQTASELGISHYRTDWYEYDDELSIAENLDHFRKRLAQLAELNEKYQIEGDYQNHSGSGFGASIWDLWMVLEDLDSDWLGSQYDVRHATVEGSESWPVGLKLIHSHIGTMDIKDFHWSKQDGSWQVQNVPLGQGQVNFSKFFSLIKELGISVPLSVHYEYPLGGANHGGRELTIPKDDVLNALKRDLEILRGWLGDHDLG